MNANDHMVGGTHYQTEEGTPQHWDIAIALNWDFMIYAATKYLWRLGKKGGPEKAVEDIEKAIHYLEKKREVMKSQLSQGVPEPGKVFHPQPSILPHVPINGPFFGIAPDEPGAPTKGYVNQD